MVADRKGIGTDDGARDGGQVVLEEGLGRCAAEAVLGRIVPLWARGGLAQHVEETDHPRREGTGVLRAEQVYDVALLERVVVVPRLGVDAAHARATVQRRVGRGAQPRLAKHQSLQVLQCAAERKRVTVSRGRRAAAARRAVAQGRNK